jgi:hypothetical protein
VVFFAGASLHVPSAAQGRSSADGKEEDFPIPQSMRKKTSIAGMHFEFFCGLKSNAAQLPGILNLNALAVRRRF